jgi:hypothetical protein
MLSSPASRLAAFAAGLCLIGGGAAAVGSATDPTPPFQDCLKVAADRAGVETDSMAGGGGEAMIPVVPGADGRRSQLAGLTLSPESTRLAAGGARTASCCTSSSRARTSRATSTCTRGCTGTARSRSTSPRHALAATGPSPTSSPAAASTCWAPRS